MEEFNNVNALSAIQWQIENNGILLGVDEATKLLDTVTVAYMDEENVYYTKDLVISSHAK